MIKKAQYSNVFSIILWVIFLTVVIIGIGYILTIITGTE